MADDIIPLRRSYVQTMVGRVSALEAENERLRAAGDALARVVAIDIAVQLFGASSTHTQVAADRVKAWHEACRG